MKVSIASSSQEIELVIDTLVIEGPWRVDGNRVAEALCAQLAAGLVAQEGRGALHARELTLPQLGGAMIRPSLHTTSAGLGAEIASSLLRSLESVTEIGESQQESPWKSG